MRKIIGILCAATLIFGGCDWLEENVPTGLTEDEVVEGLRTALMVGTDTSASLLSQVNGYYGNELIKIPLPDEAVKVKNEINSILSLAPSLSTYFNLDQYFEDVVKSVNRAAEDAAKDSAPIFKNAITGLSISQGWDILNGKVPGGNTNSTGDFDSTAATAYLMQETYSPLTSLYSPKIDKALDKDLGLGFSANDAWSTLRTAYNTSVNKIKGNYLANLALEQTGYTLEPLQTETIGTFATGKALDGLFYKVSEEEKQIRKNPFEWALDIIRKVFGSGQKNQNS